MTRQEKIAAIQALAAEHTDNLAAVDAAGLMPGFVAEIKAALVKGFDAKVAKIFYPDPKAENLLARTLVSTSVRAPTNAGKKKKS